MSDLPTLDTLPDLDRLATLAGATKIRPDPLSREDRARVDRLTALDPCCILPETIRKPSSSRKTTG